MLSKTLLSIPEQATKYLCLVYLSEENWNACADAKCFDFASGLHQSGRLLAAEPLHPIETATTLRVRNGQNEYLSSSR